MRKFLILIALAGLAPMLSACASAQAKSTTDQPGLAVPPPPPHVVPITAEPVVEPVAEIPAPSTAPANRPAGRGTRESSPKAAAPESKTDPKADAKPPEQAAPPDTAPAAPPAPAPQLRTAESTGAETAVRASIDRARNLLNSVDYRRLSSVRQKAYDDAKAFAQQAEDALKSGNVVFAQGVATKSETLAKELAGK